MRHIIILLLLLLLTGGIIAQDNIEMIESGQPESYLVGTWQIDSRRNINMLQRNAEPEWEETSAVSQIVPWLEGHALLETIIGDWQGSTYYATFFRGAKNSGNRWDAVWADNLINDMLRFSGEGDNDGNMTFRGLSGVGTLEIQINRASDDEFEWSLAQKASRTAEPNVVWTMHYTRADENTSFDDLSKGIKETTERVIPPPEIDDFNFLLGVWDIASTMRGQETQPARNTVRLINDGHAYMENWEALWEDGFTFFTMTKWDIQRGYYLNYFWSNGGKNPQFFPGGTCQGEGADKECRWAGTFYNITENTIDWSTDGSAAQNPQWKMEFTRAEGAESN